MFIRIWSFETVAENAARFEEFESREGLPMVQSQPGCREVVLVRRTPEPGGNPKVVQYAMISRWESYQAIQQALASSGWQEEVKLFLAQGFGQNNGSAVVYEQVAGPGAL